jgi:hypothetical protein
MTDVLIGATFGPNIRRSHGDKGRGGDWATSSKGTRKDPPLEPSEGHRPTLTMNVGLQDMERKASLF